MLNNYQGIYFVHAIDSTTDFLREFSDLKRSNYLTIEPNEESVNGIIEKIESFEPNSLIVFLGHGYSTGLYSPETPDFTKRVIIDATSGNKILDGHDVILLSCKSADFIKHLKTYRSIIGFGNILSSMDEVVGEADYTGQFRKLSLDDIDDFNRTYVNSIKYAIELLINNKIYFKDLPKWISYYINKKINLVLRKKELSNRIELARLLFEFRNEMIYKIR